MEGTYLQPAKSTPSPRGRTLSELRQDKKLKALNILDAPIHKEDDAACIAPPASASDVPFRPLLAHSGVSKALFANPSLIQPRQCELEDEVASPSPEKYKRHSVQDFQKALDQFKPKLISCDSLLSL